MDFERMCKVEAQLMKCQEITEFVRNESRGHRGISWEASVCTSAFALNT